MARCGVRLAVLSALLLAGLPTCGLAITYYVRQSGDDAHDGRSPATAWRHVAKLSDVMQAGDTAYVGPGLYREEIEVRYDGRPDAPITFVADTTGRETGDRAGAVVLAGSEPVDEAIFVPHGPAGVFRAEVTAFQPWGAVEMDGPQRRYVRAIITREYLVEKQAPLDVVAALPSSWHYDDAARVLYLHTSDGRPPRAHELELLRRQCGISVRGRHHVTVIGFTFRHMQDAGVGFYAGSGNGVVVHVTAYGSRQGVRVYGARDVLVTSSTLFRNENSGVYFAAESTGGVASGNTQPANVQALQQTICTPDSNDCTQDPPCNPANGQCEHPAAPDSTPCTDTDGEVCTLAGCELGMCVQTHVEDNCPVRPDHFTCYEIKPFNFANIPGVTLVDQFGSSTLTVQRPNKLCAPANKNDEDPTAPMHPDHLTAYRVRNRSIKVLNQTVVNQFGSIKLDVVKTDLLFVPTAKSLAAPAPPQPADPAVDHFQCYKVKRSKGTPKFQKILGVQVEDQFGAGAFDLLKPSHLCAPVNKRNEDPGAELHPDHLLCYKVKARAPFNQKRVWLGNQLGPLNDLTLVRRQEFCVPSLKNPGASTTSTTAAPTTTTTTTTQAPTTTTTTTTSTTTTTLGGSPSPAFLARPVD